MAESPHILPNLTGTVTFQDPVKAYFHGGFSDVFQGQLKGCTVAVKALRFQGRRDDAQQSQSLRIRLRREELAWVQLDHRNVLKIYGHCELKDYLYGFVSPWLDGGSAAVYILENTGIDRLCLCAQISAGLAYLHTQNIVHGDLKGGNVLIDTRENYPRAVLCDFGQSRLLDTQGFTTSGGKYTLAWTAKELFTSGSQVTKESDIWSLGMTAYEMFHSHRPFSDVDWFMLPTHILRGDHPVFEPISRENGLTDELRQLLVTCWRDMPSERPLAEAAWSYFDHMHLRRIKCKC